MERPAPDPRKLLTHWMEWEKGDSTPGAVLADLKRFGMRDVLEQLVEVVEAEAAKAGGGDGS